MIEHIIFGIILISSSMGFGMISYFYAWLFFSPLYRKIKTIVYNLNKRIGKNV